MTRSWPLLLLATAVALGILPALALLRAGRLEARGRLDEARPATRRGGLGLAAAAAGCAAAAGIASDAVSSALFLAAGATALLAGLSRKPRPSGWFAAILFAAGVGLALFR
jgi:hypothetical protein